MTLSFSYITSWTNPKVSYKDAYMKALPPSYRFTFVGNSVEGFDTEIMKKRIEVQYQSEKVSYKKSGICSE